MIWIVREWEWEGVGPKGEGEAEELLGDFSEEFLGSLELEAVVTITTLEHRWAHIGLLGLTIKPTCAHIEVAVVECWHANG